MKLLLSITCILLIVAYAVGVQFFYKDKFAQDLTVKAERLISTAAGLENVSVEFRAFDAFLSGRVSTPEHRDRAAQLIASLPAARVVSNGIAYPGFDPGAASRAADAEISRLRTSSPEIAGSEPPKPLPPPLPPPKEPATLDFAASGNTITLRGAVPDITTKSAFLRAIALSGRYLEVVGNEFTIDPEVAPANWPGALPNFAAFLLTRTTEARLVINDSEIDVTATAFDSVSREQILRRINQLEFPGRHLRIDVAQAPDLEMVPDAFFFKATLEDVRLVVHGRLSEASSRERIDTVLKTDLPGVVIQNELAVVTALNTPDWSRRLPNLLSLVCTRTDGARLSAKGSELRVIAEMKPGQSPEDLADILSLMTGPAVTLETRLLPFEEEISNSPATLN